MKATRIYVRFFRSFNYDYERKAHPDARPLNWEKIGEAWFPFIRIDLDEVVTAVVGANESGKSHLIDAIQRALTGEDIHRSDFCRYSSLFSVELGELRVPEFGVQLTVDTEEERGALTKAIPKAAIDRSFTLLRLDGERNILIDSAGDEVTLTARQLASLQNHMPVPFRLETDVPIPDSLSIDGLITKTNRKLTSRTSRWDFIEFFQKSSLTKPEQIAEKADEILGLLNKTEQRAAKEATPKVSGQDLGRKLLFEVSNIDPSRIADLRDALRAGVEGRVGGLVEEMNRAIARHLNFTRWWRQDSDFQLRIAPRERELVFTIRDRTGTDYSFSERSRGLMYFLSYYVQLRAHARSSGRAELLLLDEPDAYLSNTGQQDLLRILEHFAYPDTGEPRSQVVYVTHSPFLINKNAAHRIRVLDKGTDREGTRVVRDIARNGYEPLRSSIGAFVAETAFIGGANLFVEGVADQVLLAAVTTALRERGVASTRTLDLNEITIVPAGSASSVPYMAYLARGRDEKKPACVALLDGDEQGRDAQKRLSRGDVARRQILDSRWVLNIADWARECGVTVPSGVIITETEDLIPLEVAAEAARNYAEKLFDVQTDGAGKLIADAIQAQLADQSGRTWKALRAAFEEAYSGQHIDKIGFAREVAFLIGGASATTSSAESEVEILVQNFGELIAVLSRMLAEAVAEESERRRAKSLRRIVTGFLGDHLEGSTKDSADAALREIEAGLSDTVEDDLLRTDIHRLKRDFQLDADPMSSIGDFGEFRDRLEALLTSVRREYQEPIGS